MNKRKSISKSTRTSVYLMYNGHCAYCGTEIDYKDMQVDHATPLRIGGADDISNYMPACRSCNHCYYENSELCEECVHKANNSNTESKNLLKAGENDE